MKQLKYNECEKGDIIVNRAGEEAKILAVLKEGLVKTFWEDNNDIIAFTWEKVEGYTKSEDWHIKETNCLKCSYGHNDFDFNYCPFCGRKLE